VAGAIRVRAPASTANVGPGFDCVGIALDLWNELEVREDPQAPPPDLDHLGIRAFSRLASPEGRVFLFSERIPRARGLGSSAAAIALGLVAGARAAGAKLDAEALLALGLPLEGHPDNLAPALAGGVCLTWEGRIARLAASAPAVPVVLVPPEQVETAQARAALPREVSHADAAFTVARAVLLGAGLASGSPALFAAALADRLHEPYRSPFLAEVRASLPAQALGATLSGSGPSVVVWAQPGQVEECRAALAERFPEVEVLPLAVAPRGALP
jgi:homoserine kinase